MKLLVVLVVFLYFSQICFTQNGGKRGPNKGRDKDFEKGQQGYNQLLGMLSKNPEELEYIQSQYDQKFYEYILVGILQQHFEEYIQSYKIENGEEVDIPEDSPYQIPTLKESEQYIDTVIKAIFKVKQSTHIKKFSDILSQPIVKEEGLGIKSVSDLPNTKPYKIQRFSQVIMEQYHQLIFDENDKEKYVDDLKESLDNVSQYYVDDRDVDEAEIKRLFRLNKRLNSSSTWAQKYFSDKNFQNTIDNLINSDGNFEDALAAFMENDEELEDFLSGDEESWDELSKQAHQIAQQNDFDTDEIDYMLEKYKEKQRIEEEERKRKEQEERNKKHDSTVLMVIGGVMFSIALFCVLRHLRQKKLQRDSMKGQSGYHQEL